MINISTSLKKILSDKNMTQIKLAELSGVSTGGINFIIRENKAELKTLDKIAEVLEVHPGCFFEGDTQQLAEFFHREIDPTYEMLLAEKDLRIAELKEMIESQREQIRLLKRQLQ